MLAAHARVAIAAWGVKEDQDVGGTIAWLEIIHLYLLAFFGRTVSMQRRIELLWRVLNFLRISRNWLTEVDHDTDEPYDLETSFVSRQTYAHMLISVHGAMLKIKLAQQLDAQLDLDQIGSDCLESFFSELGGCGRFMSNRRNYGFGSVLDMASDVNHMNVLLGDPDPEVAFSIGRVHRKMEMHHRFLEEPSDCADALTSGSECPGDPEMIHL